MENKLGKREAVAINGKNTDNKGKKGWTLKRKLAAGIIGAGILSLIIFVVMIFVFDLGPVREIKSSEQDSRVVGSVAGFEVRYEELRYVTLTYRAELDAELGKYESLSPEDRAEYEKTLEERVLDELKNNYIILSLCQKYGVKIKSNEAKKFVNNSIEELVDEIGGKDEYKKWLADSNLTDAFLRLIYKVEFLEGELLDELVKRGEDIKYSEADLDAFVDFIVGDKSYAKTTHVFYPKEDKYIDVSNIRERAIADLETINSAESDEERKKLLDKCIGTNPVFQQETEFYFTYAQMGDEYEKAAFSLNEYGVSELLELEDGYYIIMRLPKEVDEVAARARMLLPQYRYAVLKQICNKQEAEIGFEPNDYFGSLKLIEIK